MTALYCETKMVTFNHLNLTIMPSITLKDISEPLLERIKIQATRDKRSLNREILWLLEQAVTSSPHDPASLAKQQRDTQLNAWQKLAGRWQGSATEINTIVSDIYQARSQGREFNW